MTTRALSAQYRAIMAQSRPDTPKMLGVLLCYNDADILADVIEHLLVNNHDLVVWDHGSTDGTAAVLDRYTKHLAERTFVPRSVDFYGLYQAMSQHLIDTWVSQYDWISWPDQDEILEGPDRTQSYAKHIHRVYAQGGDWVVFNNINYWWTQKDLDAIGSPVRRVRHYSHFADCAPRVRAWRASQTNIRLFNHNPIAGRRAKAMFNLRHYPMRTQEQMLRRIAKDRNNLQRGAMNYHYNHMAQAQDRLLVRPDQLHHDDGVAELCLDTKFNWRIIYGGAPS